MLYEFPLCGCQIKLNVCFFTALSAMFSEKRNEAMAFGFILPLQKEDVLQQRCFERVHE